MKKHTVLFASGILCLCFLAAYVQAKEGPSAKDSKQINQSVQITYDLHRIPTTGSNQVAVWVENENGQFIRTLFVTRFTAKGGYLKRTSSLKGWVEKSSWKDATKDEIDALSSATPAAGKQNVTWDCTDAKGQPVPAGTYYICMEGNLRKGNMMYAKAKLEIGKNSQKVVADLSFIPEEGKSEPLFDNVMVDYTK